MIDKLDAYIKIKHFYVLKDSEHSEKATHEMGANIWKSYVWQGVDIKSLSL